MTKLGRAMIGLFLFIVLAGCLWSVTAAQAQADPFYKGKSIRVVVGTTPGGFYDRWARLIARHLPKYIPGNPEVIVQNMPGAGSVIAANYVYNVAKPDGLALGMALSGIYLDQLVGRKEAQFDVRKFVWIGSPERTPMVLYMRADAPYKSLEDIRGAKEPPKCGSTGTSSSDYVLARLLEDTLPPVKINTVLGYPGGSEIDLAVERGEVICRGMTASPFFGREPFLSWRKKNFVRVIVYTGRSRDSRIPDTPTLREIFERDKVSDASRRVAQVLLASEDFGRPMVGPPGTPPDRVKVLRAGYDKAMKDPELVGEAKRGRMDMDPVSGEELERLARSVLDQPPEVLERVKRILK